MIKRDTNEQLINVTLWTLISEDYLNPALYPKCRKITWHVVWNLGLNKRILHDIFYYMIPRNFAGVATTG